MPVFVIAMIVGIALTTHNEGIASHTGCRVTDVKFPGFMDGKAVRVATSCGLFTTIDQDSATRLKIGAIYDIKATTINANGARNRVLKGFIEVTRPSTP